MRAKAGPPRPAVPSSRELRRRRGAVLVLFALLLVLLMAMIAFAVDIGFIVNSRTDLQRSVDAGALAGAGALIDGPDAARPVVVEYVRLNPIGSRTLEDSDVEVVTGDWDPESRSFYPSDETPSALRVTVDLNDQPLFFARVLGREEFDLTAQATARFQPRDIMLVLDFSASMNDDSSYGSALGNTWVTTNLATMYAELGSPVYGGMSFNGVYISSTSNSTIRSTLGLSGVAWPYPGGSWNDYYSYVQTDSKINSAGLRKRYGYKTLLNYWQQQQPTAAQTPDLWKTSEQPVKSLKDAVTAFIAYMEEVDTEDQIGLAIYTASDGTALLESGLTDDFAHVSNIMVHRQAGHHHTNTNIGDGMKEGRLELEDNARLGAAKLMVLMTDGLANMPSNTTVARRLVLSEAARAADANIPIVTISLGAGADTDIMQDVADITGGAHFNVPGGQTVAEVEEDLKEIFRQVADDRPLMLVE